MDLNEQFENVISYTTTLNELLYSINYFSYGQNEPLSNINGEEKANTVSEGAISVDLETSKICLLINHISDYLETNIENAEKPNIDLIDKSLLPKGARISNFMHQKMFEYNKYLEKAQTLKTLKHIIETRKSGSKWYILFILN